MRHIILALAIAGAATAPACTRAEAVGQPPALAFAPDVPPATGRRAPMVVHVDLSSTVTEIGLPNGARYKAWTFNDHAPGPFIRARVGDTLEVTITNNDPSGMPHNLDFHAVSGPGGGGAVTTVAGGAK